MPSTTIVDPGGVIAICRATVRVRGTGIAPGIWHVGLFANDVQQAQIPFENKEWKTYEMPLVTLNRGDLVDVRIYVLPGEATAPGQICEWRLENMCQNGCDAYAGGPLEGFATFNAQETCDACAAIDEAMDFASAYDGGGDFEDPGEWNPSSAYADPEEPPWEDFSDPQDPGPGSDLRFEPVAP